MPNKRLILIIGVALLLVTSPAFAQRLESKEYKVQRGDTLWDISKKELHDSFLWPKVWKENPEISNPDKLIPGQTIKIPLYLIQKEEPKEEAAPSPVVVVEPPKAVTVVKTLPVPESIKPLVDANLLMSGGYISGTSADLGKISGSPSGKILLSTVDMIYIETKSVARLGDRFFIVTKGPVITHPVTNNPMGNIVEIVGIAEVKKYENGETIAQIVKAYNSIEAGDQLDNFREIKPPVVAKPYRTPDVSGYIVGAKDLKLYSSNYDIVYIDKGKKDGLEVGDLLKTVAVGKHKITNGVVQIINALDSTSVAIVRESSGPIERGNLVTKQTGQ